MIYPTFNTNAYAIVRPVDGKLLYLCDGDNLKRPVFTRETGVCYPCLFTSRSFAEECVVDCELPQSEMEGAYVIAVKLAVEPSPDPVEQALDRIA